jgi:hypothetical protein
MDQAGDGHVDTYDFFRWVSEMDKSNHSSFLWKAVAGQEGGSAAVAGQARITIRHLLRILWPKAETEDLDHMIDYIEQRHTQELLLVPEPTEMPQEMRSDLVKVFESLDADKSKYITVEELVGEGYMSRDDAVSKMAKFAKGEEKLSCEQFIEMMCPDGYRCTKDQTFALCADGDGCVIRLNPNDGNWYRSKLKNKRFLRSLYPERYSELLSAAAH